VGWVGETISYIEKKVQKKQENVRKTLGKPASSDATPTTGSGATPPPTNKTPALRYILESDFDDEVLRQTGPVLVFFCTEYEDPCGVMAPTISSIAQEQQGRLKTVAIDVNINKNLPKKYDAGYFEVPVTIYFSGGAEKGRIAGAASMIAVRDGPVTVSEVEPFVRSQLSKPYPSPLEHCVSRGESVFRTSFIAHSLPWDASHALKTGFRKLGLV
jgi:thioredoxin 1